MRDKRRLFLFVGLVILLTSSVVGCGQTTSAPPTSPTDESKGYFEQGNIYLEQEQWDKAITEFSKAIKLNPEFEVVARVGRGKASAWAGYFEQALDDFEEAFYIDYYNTEIQFYGGSWNSLMNADAYVAWGIAATAEDSSPGGGEAKDLFDKAISRDPNNSDAYTGRALWFLHKAYGYGHREVTTAWSIGHGYLAQATSDFEKAIELDPEGSQRRIKRFNFEDDMAFLPNYIEANNLRGAVLVGVSGYRYYDRALEAYDRVLKVAPKNVEALVGQGNAYMALGQNDKAILSFNAALELEPYNADAYAGLAIAYTKQNQYDLAIVDFERAILLDIGYSQGEYDDAYATPGLYEADKENVIGFAPSYIRAYTSRGYGHLDDGEYQLAIADFSKGIAFQPDRSYSFSEFTNMYAYAYMGRAISYTRTKEYEKAIDDFDIANGYYRLDVSYGNPFTTESQEYIARAIAYSWTGRYGQAIEDFRNAKMYANFSMDADAYFARGFAYKSWGLPSDKGLAIADFEKFIALAPSSPRVEEAQRYINELRKD